MIQMNEVLHSTGLCKQMCDQEIKTYLMRNICHHVSGHQF